jgi:hypothetical protein
MVLPTCGRKLSEEKLQHLVSHPKWELLETVDRLYLEMCEGPVCRKDHRRAMSRMWYFLVSKLRPVDEAANYELDKEKLTRNIGQEEEAYMSFKVKTLGNAMAEETKGDCCKLKEDNSKGRRHLGIAETMIFGGWVCRRRKQTRHPITKKNKVTLVTTGPRREVRIIGCCPRPCNSHSPFCIRCKSVVSICTAILSKAMWCI